MDSERHGKWERRLRKLGPGFRVARQFSYFWVVSENTNTFLSTTCCCMNGCASPMAIFTLLIKGLHFDIHAEPTQAAEGWLDQHCTLLNSEHLVHDPGAKWKQRFAPQTGQLERRIEIRSYSCSH